jgi:hypothetical protein
MQLHNFRAREWKPALRAAGDRGAEDLRSAPHHATFSLAAGVSLVTLSRRMGTSVEIPGLLLLLLGERSGTDRAPAILRHAMTQST